MMRAWIRVVAVVSLALNLALGWALVRRDATGTSVGELAVPGPSSIPVPARLDEPAIPQPDPAVDPPAARPTWAEIRDENWEVYRQNLRALGCPERTMQAALVADVRHWYEAEWASRPAETNYWMIGSERAAKRREAQALRRQVELEERAFLEELLGVRWYELPAYVASMEREAWGHELLGFLPDDRLDRANGLFIKLADYWEQIEEGESRWMTDAEIAKVRRDFSGIVAEFRQVMSPAEIEEMELRLMTIDVLDVWGVEQQFGSALSGREFRELLRIRRGATDVFEEMFVAEFLEETGSSPVGPIVDPARDQEQSEALRTLLGPARYEGYLRAQDFEYRHLSRSIRALGLPSETVWAVYDIRQTARDTVANVGSNPSFSEPERRAMLESIREETRRTLRSALGATAYEAYARDGGDWVDALIGSPP